jgi:hypothetical protein
MIRNVRMMSESVTSTNARNPFGHDSDTTSKFRTNPRSEIRTGHSDTFPPPYRGGNVRNSPPLCSECQAFCTLDDNDLCSDCNARRANPGELGPLDPATAF